ncbi:MAG: hypothetical protein ACFN00_06205 [Flavobacteriaceae bacterium]
MNTLNELISLYLRKFLRGFIMLKIARIFIIVICCILICILGTLYSFIRFRNPSNVGIFARWFGRLHPLFGLKVEHRFPANADKVGRCIYILNYQSPEGELKEKMKHYISSKDIYLNHDEFMEMLKFLEKEYSII